MKIHMALGDGTPGVQEKLNHLPEFEAETGIKVTFDWMPAGPLYEKSLLDFSQGTGIYDIVQTSSGWGAGFTNGKYLEPLDDYISDPELTNAQELDIEDILSLNLDVMTFGGKRYGFPHFGHANILIYRMDILDQLKLDIPKTFDQFEQVAQMITDAKLKTADGEQVYACALAGNASYFDRLVPVIKGMGGRMLDENKRPALTEKPALDALEWYARMIKKYSTPSSVNGGFIEMEQASQGGTCALMLDYGPFIEFTEDKKASKTVGLWALADHPTDGRPLKGCVYYSLWAFSMSAGSKNKKAAWKVLSWFSSRKLNDQLLAEGYLFRGMVTRKSESEAPGIKGQPWTEAAMRATQATDVEAIPRIPESKQLTDIAGAHMNAAITDLETPADAWQKASAEMDPILKDAGYYQ